jgi:hypothetical protein
MEMEPNYTRFRVLLFVGLHVAFYAWAYPLVPNEHAQAAGRAFGSIFFVFTAGAYMSCFCEMQFGLFPPNSFRPLFLLGGAAFMILAIALVYSWK